MPRELAKKKGYTSQLRTWWKDNGFTQHNWAWF